MRRLFLVIVMGMGGVAVLLALGFWQVRRLEWKEALLAGIEARIGDAPVALPAYPDPEADRYLPVAVEGRIGAPMIRVLASRKPDGAGHRLIVPFEAAGDSGAGRRIMVDLGFLPQTQELPPLPEGPLAVTGNLHWPDETDGFTPDPDRDANLWFAREVGALAAELETEPLLVVRRGGDPVSGVDAMPVGTEGIPNDHLGYAVTWFSLAAIWLAMTGFLVYRMRKPEGAGT